MERSESQQNKYTQLAKEAGYPARSIYKLKEIDRKYKIFKRGDRVLDLGSSPGSWMMYIAKSVKKEGTVVGTDTVPLSIQIPSNALFLQKDLFDASLEELDPFDAVVSDAAPKTSGMKERDAARSLQMAERALELAEKIGKKDSQFVCKVFEGQDIKGFTDIVRKVFQETHVFHSKASPRGSSEVYVIGKKKI
jgi:23S rRNA (uridine2552-2'-O)-methyltransferase